MIPSGASTILTFCRPGVSEVPQEITEIMFDQQYPVSATLQKDGSTANLIISTTRTIMMMSRRTIMNPRMAAKGYKDLLQQDEDEKLMDAETLERSVALTLKRKGEETQQ